LLLLGTKHIEQTKRKGKVLKITVFAALVTGGLVTNEALSATGYRLAGLLAACGFLVIAWIYAIQKES
jgi:hypothetical protein